MGYSTDFEGQFDLDRQLSPEHQAYLEAFAGTRRIKRDPDKAALLSDPVREAVGLPIGDDGGYYVGDDRDDFQSSVIDYNVSPGCEKISTGDYEGGWKRNQQRIEDGLCQPGLWCQWVPTEDGKGIVWDGGEKFYDYVPWLKYLIAYFLKPWGYVLNGEVTWQGEEASDIGKIRVDNNVVMVAKGKVIYEYEDATEA